MKILNNLIADIIKSVVPKCDHSRTKIGFLTKFKVHWVLKLDFEIMAVKMRIVVPVILE